MSNWKNLDTLDSYKEIVIDDIICEYQYVLYDHEEANEVTDAQAEKYACIFSA